MSQSDFEIYSPSPRPVVNVSPEVFKELGNPVVDTDSLSELYYGDLSLPRDVQPRILFKPLRGGTYGLHLPLSNKITIDPIKSTQPESSYSLPEVLIHESKHLVDSANHPVKAVIFSGSRVGVYGITSYLTYKAMKEGYLPDVGETLQKLTGTEGALGSLAAGYIDIKLISMGIGGKIGSKIYYKYLDPSEKSARKAQNRDDLLYKYQNAIYFPGSSRNILGNLFS